MESGRGELAVGAMCSSIILDVKNNLLYNLVSP
jgi:hypothetical protein